MGDRATTAIDRIAAAHQRLLADGSTQVELPAYHSPEPPAWAKALGEWFHRHASEFAALGPVVKFAFWGGLALLLGLLLLGVYCWLAPRFRRDSTEAVADVGWRPDAAPARALLAEADALASRGEFAAAARLVLLRSVEQIEAHRSDSLAPALTSRDIARSPRLPGDVATAFALITEVVETGLFAARPVGADAWTRARTAYEGVAFPAAWA
ncbi:hypothetical protein [Polymorphobacter megasporae]|uniref:hypothetical protein n=1 Tax=Glacieibacterium megasporae TaxID=2835787 RepID=UPI001C1E1844|nr:hypothetical protein [Polymorphobacter megasporae]UAJ09762.1 hypothetical protein KTC28_15915 [Polymorphobacter megasporae]